MTIFDTSIFEHNEFLDFMLFSFSKSASNFGDVSALSGIPEDFREGEFESIFEHDEFLCLIFSSFLINTSNFGDPSALEGIPEDYSSIQETEVLSE